MNLMKYLFFETLLSISEKIGYRMAPVDKNQGGREFTPAQKMFVCDLKMKGTKYTTIKTLFMAKFNKAPPTRQGLHYLTTKLKNKFTLLDQRKGRVGKKISVRTPRNIASVKRSLERASHRSPGQPGPSARRHSENLSKSTYNWITRGDLKFKPFKIMRLHKVTDMQTEARLKMGRLLERKTFSWYSNLCVSDEALFSLSGHVFNRQNTVCYAGLEKIKIV